MRTKRGKGQLIRRSLVHWLIARNLTHYFHMLYQSYLALTSLRAM